MKNNKNKLKFKTLGNKICVKRDATLEKIGIILLSEKAKEQPKTGVIISIGDDVKLLEVGNKVIFTTYSGHEVKIDGQELIVMEEDDVLGILEN